MRHIAGRLVVSGVMFSAAALWVAGAEGQALSGSSGGPGNVAGAKGAETPSLTRPHSRAGVTDSERALPAASKIIARLLEKNQQRLAALEHYESDRIYRVDYKGTGGQHHAELHVHAVYTGPNQKHFTVVSESGPKFLREKVLRKLVESEQEATAPSNRMQNTLGPENYTAELLGEQVVPGAGGSVRAWMLRMTPKVENKFTYRGTIWVSEDDYAVMRVLGEPAKSPSWWINRASFDSQYVRRGDVWLPARNVSSSHVRFGGEATLTIDYGTYPVVSARALKPGGENAEITTPTGASTQ